MIVTCDHCGARYRLDESKIPGRGARVTCPSCRHVFVVYRRENTKEVPRAAIMAPPKLASPARPSVEEEAAGLNVSTLDFRSVGLSSWKVKVKIGLIYDFNDFKTFNKNIRDGRVTATDLISFGGSDWSPIGNLNAISQRFCEVYVRAKRANDSVEDDELGEDEPTRIMSVPPGMSGESTRKPLIAPVQDEPAVPSVSVGKGEPANPENMASAAALADALADAAAEVDGGAAWKSGKAGSNQAPRFVDPFEKKGRQTKPRRKVPSKPTESEGNNNLLVAAVVLIGLLLGGGIWVTIQQSKAEVNSSRGTNPSTGNANGSGDDPPSNPDRIRENIIERINQTAEPVVEEPTESGVDEWGITEEQELIVVIPEEFREGNGGNSALEQNGTMSVDGGESASGYAADGDAQAQSANWGAAAAAYQKASDLEPRNTRYIEKLCEYRYRSGNVSSARGICSQAKQYGACAASKWLGHISYDQGDMSGAAGHYQSYLSSCNPADRNEIQRRIDSISGG